MIDLDLYFVQEAKKALDDALARCSYSERAMRVYQGEEQISVDDLEAFKLRKYAGKFSLIPTKNFVYAVVVDAEPTLRGLSREEEAALSIDQDTRVTYESYINGRIDAFKQVYLVTWPEDCVLYQYGDSIIDFLSENKPDSLKGKNFYCGTVFVGQIRKATKKERSEAILNGMSVKEYLLHKVYGGV